MIFDSMHIEAVSLFGIGADLSKSAEPCITRETVGRCPPDQGCLAGLPARADLPALGVWQPLRSTR